MPLRADLVAAAIARLSGQFGTYARRRGFPDAALRIQHLRTGSVIAKLIAIADGAAKIVEHGDVVAQLREILAGFYQQLYMAWLNVSVGMGSRINARDRKTLEEIAGPVIRDQAISISVTIQGDNSPSFILIDKNFAEALRAANADPGIEQIDMKEVASVAAKVAPGNVLSASEIDEAVVLAGDPASRRLFDSEPAIGRFRSEPARQWRGVEHTRVAMGTALHAGGRWYVRYEGGQGAMVPLTVSPETAVDMDRAATYLASGRLNLTAQQVPYSFDAERLVIRADREA